VALELKIPPDFIALIVGVGMWLASRVTDSLDVPLIPRVLIGVPLLVLAVVLVISARVSLARAGTTFNPTAPARSTDLVTSGAYGFSRNPMYLGTFLVLLGLGVLLGNALSLLLSLVFVAYMNRFQIRPEERALRVRFGESYDNYARGVRRWL
jgi:protein-S-isoprenylcysteine O-methyltransferase Ste14